MKNKVLYTRSSQHLNPQSNLLQAKNFGDGEISITLNTDLQNKHIVIVGSTNTPGDNLLETLFLTDAVARKKVKKITLIIPYFGYSRADREGKNKEIPSGLTVLKIFKNLLQNKGKIVTVDFHSHILKKLFKKTLQNITALDLLADQFVNFKNLTVVAPDQGAANNARKFANKVKSKSLFVLTKTRISDSEVKIESLSGKMLENVVIVDDMISSGSTILEAVKILQSNGVKNIFVAATHMIYSAGGYKRLNESKLIKGIYTTNTIKPPTSLSSKFKIISILPLIKGLIER